PVVPSRRSSDLKAVCPRPNRRQIYRGPIEWCILNFQVWILQCWLAKVQVHCRGCQFGLFFSRLGSFKLKNPSYEFYTFGGAFFAFQMVCEMCSYFLNESVAYYFSLLFIETFNFFALIIYFAGFNFSKFIFKGFYGWRKFAIICPLIEFLFYFSNNLFCQGKLCRTLFQGLVCYRGKMIHMH